MNRPEEHKLYESRLAMGFTQDEMAFLLGASSGSRVSRYESFKRLPQLNMVMAYLAVHQRSLQDLFAGHYRDVAISVLDRARELRERVKATGNDERKVELLNSMILVLERGLQEHDE